MARIDLHLHTTYSDGSLSPTMVVELAQKVGLAALAITDHDSTDGLSEAMMAATSYGIEVIPGIEITSVYQGAETHILGYFFNSHDAPFERRLRDLRETRHDRNREIVHVLTSLGLPLTYQEVQDVAGHGSVGRPHIAQVLVTKGYVRTIGEAFDRYLKQGALAYIPRTLPSTAEVISWIREAGGIAVLAHPNWVQGKGEEIGNICRILKDKGLQGIEVFYSTHSPRQTAHYLSLAHNLALLITGGSDFHGVAKPGIEIGKGKGTLKVSEKLLGALRLAAGSHPTSP